MTGCTTDTVICPQFVVPEAFQWEAGDQIFLNSYFSGRFHVLPNTYNLWAGTRAKSSCVYLKTRLPGVLDGFYRWPFPFHANLRLVHHNRLSSQPIPEQEEACDTNTHYYCTACCRRMVSLHSRVRTIVAASL